MEGKAGTAVKMLALRLLLCSGKWNNLRRPNIIHHLQIRRGIDSAKIGISICIYEDEKPLERAFNQLALKHYFIYYCFKKVW